MTERGVIRLSQFINHPPAKVWKALTDPEIHAKWWAAGDVKAVVGHRFTLDMGPWGQQPCEVLAVEPERLLSYSFAPGTLDSTITWRLEPENGGTRLHLEHAVLTSILRWEKKPSRAWVAAGRPSWNASRRPSIPFGPFQFERPPS